MLPEVVLAVLLLGLAAYVVLGGADFGAGLWYMLLAGRRRRPLQDHTYHAMGPVWEANHVWLIFVLVVAWTAFPRVFGALFSTLYIPLFLAAIGIIMRGATYALRGWAERRGEERIVGIVFGISSFLTPFALGAAVGGVASERVPVGNAAGDPWDSWLNPTSIAIGLIAVAACAYLAAVWLTADAARRGDAALVRGFRKRALATGAVAGALAVAGLLVLRADAERIYEGLTSGAGVVAVAGSVAAGLATIAWVLLGRFEAARWSAAVAVGAIVAGWALAQEPQLLPGLSVDEAAAGDATLIALLVAIAIGAVILVPSLVLLFGMVLRGRFDEEPQELGSLAPAVSVRGGGYGAAGAPAPRLVTVAAGVAGLGALLMLLSDGGMVLYAGVFLLLAGLFVGGGALLPSVVEEEGGHGAAPRA